MTADLDHLRNALAAAKARANEAARLSAAARDEVADRDKTIAGLHERIEIVEGSRQDLAAWAVKFAMKYHAGYRERGGMDPFKAIEEALALIPDLQGYAKAAELTRSRARPDWVRKSRDEHFNRLEAIKGELANAGYADPDVDPRWIGHEVRQLVARCKALEVELAATEQMLDVAMASEDPTR